MKKRIQYSEAIEQGGRDSQQDAVWVAELLHGEAIIAVVADGMGGHAGGSIAATVLVNEIKKQTTHLQQMMANPLEFLNQIIASVHHRLFSFHGYGFTPRAAFAIVLIDLASAMTYKAHVGDCRIYCFNHGTFVSRTRDHTLVQWLFEQGEISEDEMATHPQQHKLTQALGGESMPTVSLASSKIDGEISLLLCSDGLWEQFSNAEMMQRIQQYHASELAARMATEASYRGGEDGDNISLAYLCVRIPHSKHLHVKMASSSFVTINWKSVLLWLIPTALFVGFAWSVLAPDDGKNNSHHQAVSPVFSVKPAGSNIPSANDSSEIFQNSLKKMNPPPLHPKPSEMLPQTIQSPKAASATKVKETGKNNVELPEKKQSRTDIQMPDTFHTQKSEYDRNQ